MTCGGDLSVLGGALRLLHRKPDDPLAIARPGPGSLVLATCSIFWLSIGGAMGETFVMSTDETVEGEISRAFNNTIFITLDDGGGMLPATLSEIKEIRISVDDGEVVGRLNGWENGIYEISSERYTLRVAGGKVLSVDEAVSGLGGSTDDGPIAAEAGAAAAATAPAPETTPARSDASHGPVM